MRLKKDVSPDAEIEREKPSPIKSHLYISGGKKKNIIRIQKSNQFNQYR